MDVKYICYGGTVRSKTDDQVHYIPPIKVAELYGVNPKECILVPWNNEFDRMQRLKGIDMSNYKELYPRYDGNYKLK